MTCPNKETTVMNENWHTIVDSDMDEDGGIQATARVDKDSPWFSGHFPGEPILPGVAQISLVCEAVKRHKEAKRSSQVKEIRKIRFRRVIRPEETILMQILPNDQKIESYKFKVLVNNELACNGIIVIK